MEQYQIIANIGYLISIILFIMGIKRLAKVKTARSANVMAASAMVLAMICAYYEMANQGMDVNYTLLLAGLVIGSAIGALFAVRVQMTQMPEMVGLLNGFGGMASMLVGLSLYFGEDLSQPLRMIEMNFQGFSGWGTVIALVLSVVIGAITFTGSMIAFLKLSEKMPGKPILLPGRHIVNILLITGILVGGYYWINVGTTAAEMTTAALAVTALSLVLGVLLVIPIGGADMPVVISLLNSYSGMAASATGFALNSHVLIVSGTLVGASGLILTNIMCKAMNRSLANVMVGGFGGETAAAGGGEYVNVKSADPEEAALDFESAQSVIIVPGYGLAVAQGQNACKELGDQLKSLGVQVRYAIHPVAGRMPGHMNVLLAESNVPYDDLYEMDAINKDFNSTDIALVVGANDVVNPSAKDDPGSPLYGMPVLNVDEARMVFVIKRGMGTGFSGVKNVLFEKDNTRMIFGDAKKVLEELAAHLQEEN